MGSKCTQAFHDKLYARVVASFGQFFFLLIILAVNGIKMEPLDIYCLQRFLYTFNSFNP